MTKFDRDGTAELEIPGPILVRFPIRYFEADRALEMKLHRSRFIKQMGEYYDELAEKCRAKLNELDPGTERPAIMAHVRFDISAIDAAMKEDDHEAMD
jgi:hypothetical protein